MHYFRIAKLWSIQSTTLGPKMMFGSVLEHFAILRHIKRCKTCVSGLNALFWGIEVAMHPFYSGWPKIIVGSVSEHSSNLRHIKRYNTWVSGLNAVFQTTKLWSMQHTTSDPKWCKGVFRSISLTFGTQNDAKLCFGPECTISRYRSCDASILLWLTQSDVWERFRPFR
jgi:hypothetical protein